MTVEWRDDGDSMVCYRAGRYAGWVQPAGGRLPGWWLANWRGEDGSWHDPRTERPGHLWATKAAAVAAVESALR